MPEMDHVETSVLLLGGHNGAAVALPSHRSSKLNFKHWLYSVWRFACSVHVHFLPSSFYSSNVPKTKKHAGMLWTDH